jgi:hypothetical protein
MIYNMHKILKPNFFHSASSPTAVIPKALQEQPDQSNAYDMPDKDIIISYSLASGTSRTVLQMRLSSAAMIWLNKHITFLKHVN